MKTFIVLAMGVLCFFFTSCKEKKQPTPPPPPAVVEDTVKPEPIVEEKIEQPVRNEIQKYFLIAGCFEYKENADKLCNRLQEQGYDSKIIPYFENLYLVSYNGYPTRQEALSALEKMKTEKGKEKTWVFKAEN